MCPQSCLTLRSSMNCSMPGLPVHHQLPEFTQTCPLSRWCHPIISFSVFPFSSHLQSFPTSGSFPMTQLFTWGGQSIGVSASTSVLPMNNQDWSTRMDWLDLLAVQGTLKSLLQHQVQNHQFVGTQLSLESNSHIQTWLLEKPQLWLDNLRWQSNVSAF